MDERTHDILNLIGIWVGVAMMVVGVVGELLGWWGEAGFLISIVGAIASLINLADQRGRALVAGMEHLGTGMVRGFDGLTQGHAKMLALQRATSSKQDVVMDRFERMVELQEDVRDLLDDRLSGA